MAEAALFSLALLLVLSPLLIHEMGHWALLNRYRVPVVQTWVGLGPAIAHVGKLRIGMLPIGAAVMPDPEKFEALSAQKKMWIALAGPIASFLYGFVLVAIVLGLQENSSIGTYDLLLPVAYISFFLGGLNMIPLPPLDGYQAYRFWREHNGRPIKAKIQNIAMRLGNGLVYGIGFFVLGRFLF